jgi:hypothetical protein
MVYQVNLVNRRRGVSGADACASVATLERATLIFAETAPDAMILAGFERPLQALFAHVATTTDELGFFDLENGGAGVSDREEELGVFVEARAAMAPVHDDLTPFSVLGFGLNVCLRQSLIFVIRRTSGQQPWFQQIGSQTRGMTHFLDVGSVTPVCLLWVA